jgi:hypothetical protein
VFATPKRFLRSARERAMEDAWRRAGDLIDLVQPAECSNHVVNAGDVSA